MTGSLYLVGLGPGQRDLLTLRAARILESSDAFVGFHAYVNCAARWFPSRTRRLVRLPLGQERERASLAAHLAQAGLRVALVSSGDPSIYGMAGPLFDVLCGGRLPGLNVEVVPGITAALAANAHVGAALADDTALISLSDVLVPWPTVLRRVKAAAEGGFVLSLYNPASQRRQSGIREIQQLLSTILPESTPVALVRDAQTDSPEVALSTLGRFLHAFAPDMHTLVLVGNESTQRCGDWLIAGRYRRRSPKDT